MKKIIERIVGELFVVVGLGLSTFNMLSFSSRTDTGIPIPSHGYNEPIYGVQYYYDIDAKLFIAAGVVLVTIGVFVLKRSKV